MPTQRFAALAAVLPIVLRFITSSSDGAAMAYDDAGSAVYATEFSSGQNGGFGFQPWTLNPHPDNGAVSGSFAATSELNGEGHGNIDSGGRSWGLYANISGVTSEAFRQFTAGGITGDNTLGVGEQFRLKLDNGYIDTGGKVGFGLRNSLGEDRFEFYFVGGESKYTLNIDNDVFTLHGFTSAGMSLQFTLTGLDTFTLNINYAEGSPSAETFNGTLQGTPGTGIDGLHLFNFGAGTPKKNVYFNNVEVVPEPSSLMLLGAAALAVIRRPSRHRR